MLAKFVDVVKLTRRTLDAQRLYYRTRDKETLINAKQLEDDLRALLDEADAMLKTARPNPGPADPPPPPDLLEPYQVDDPDLAQIVRRDLEDELRRVSITGHGDGEVRIVFAFGRIQDVIGLVFHRRGWKDPREESE